MVVTDPMVSAALTEFEQSLGPRPGQEKVAMRAAITAALQASPGWLTKNELAEVRHLIVHGSANSAILDEAVAKIDGLLS